MSESRAMQSPLAQRRRQKLEYDEATYGHETCEQKEERLRGERLRQEELREKEELKRQQYEQEERLRQEELKRQQDEQLRRYQQHQLDLEEGKDNNIVDKPLHKQLHDEINNLGEINNNIIVDRNAVGISRSPSQNIRSQEEYDAYIARKEQQRQLLERANKVNDFNKNKNTQPPVPKKTWIQWATGSSKGGKSRRRKHKHKQSKKVKKRNTKKNKRKNKRRSVKR